MNEPVLLPATRPYWARKGNPRYCGPECGKDQAKPSPAFPQAQWGAGRSGNRPAFNTKLVNVPRKWFGVNYRSKRGDTA